MTTGQKVDSLISDLQSVVDESVAFYGGPGATIEKQIGYWTPREVFCHLIWWHEATAQGIESVASGGEPYKYHASGDQMNARAVGRKSGRTMAQLIDEFEGVHQRLVNAAKTITNPEAIVLVNAEGTGLSAAQRLERMAKHWKGHLDEVKAL
jgi:hypothetical protein